MYSLTPHKNHCPYCGEPITLLIDTSEAEQAYIEDCEVCCRPIQVQVSIDDDALYVQLHDENAVG